MRENDIEREEQYYERYNQEDSHPSNQEEIQAFRTYARIRSQLQNAPIQDYDQKSLVRSMVDKMNEKPFRLPSFLEEARFPRFLTASAYSIVFIVSLCIAFHSFLSINRNLTESIHFLSKDNIEKDVPLLWKYRLWSGKRVTVPTGIRVTMSLSDGSTLDCQENSQISINYGQARNLNLTSGEITINASPSKKRPMTVTTPLGEVLVIGTVFTIELTP